MTKNLFLQLADSLRKEGKNFILIVEDEGIHSQSSIKGKSPLRAIAKLVKGL